MLMTMLRKKTLREKIDAEITRSLGSRGSLSDDYDRNHKYGEPQYVVRMCERIQSILGREGREVSLDKILSADRCASGHVDYQRKLALYCDELAH